MAVAYPKRQGIKAPAPTPGSFADRSAAVLGFDPDDTLEKLKEAQRRTKALREEEALLAAQAAELEARFAYPSHYEHERKAKLSLLIEQRRAELQRRGEKVVNTELDTYAHSTLDYTQFLERGLEDRKRLERLRANLVEIRGKIDTAKAAEVYFDREARLNESKIYHSGREVGA